MLTHLARVAGIFAVCLLLVFRPQAEAQAFVPAITAPALAPAATPFIVASGPIGWTVLGVAAVAGVAYVGYRGWSGDPVQWWWDSGTDPLLGADTTISNGAEYFIRCTHPDSTHTIGGIVDKGGDPYMSVVVGDGGIGINQSSAHSDKCPEPSGSPSSNVSFSSPDGGVTVEFRVSSDTDFVDYYIRRANPAVGMVVAARVADPEAPPSTGDPSFVGGATATVRADYECTDPVTSTVTQHSVHGDSYVDPTQPAAMPGTVLCPEGQRMTDAQLFRELPGHPDEPLTAPLVVPTTVPDFIPSEWETEWNDCVDLGDCELIIEDVRDAESRRMVPPWDVGWWWNPDRDSDYQCSYLMPDGTKIPLPLEQCAPLQWEWDESTKTWVNAPTTSADPTLEPPTQTGEPPGAPQMDTNCFTGGSENPEQGFVSRVVFHGVACALQWAFVPSETFMATTMGDLTASLNSTWPFSGIQVGITHVPEIFAIPGDVSCSGDIWSFPPDRPDLPDNFKLGIPCQPAWDHSAPLLIMNGMVIGGFVWGLANLWGSVVKGPRDGSTGGDDG